MSPATQKALAKKPLPGKIVQRNEGVQPPPGPVRGIRASGRIVFNAEGVQPPPGPVRGIRTKPSAGIQKLWSVGSRPNVIQIVPPRGKMRPPVRRAGDPDEMHELVIHPLAAPTGPGGAAGFRNKAGSTIQRPEVTNIYLGEFWGDQDFVDEFSVAIVENGYLDPLSELNYGTGSGTWLGSIAGPDIGRHTKISDRHIRSLLREMLQEGRLHGEENSLFMFILPDKVTSTMEDGSESCTDYCGYHDAIAWNGTHVAYAVLPSPLCKGCGGEMGDLTAVYAHELAEACTDKIPGRGWSADDGQENGDLEAWNLFGWGPPSNPNLYTVQGYYTNERGNTIGAWNSSSMVEATILLDRFEELSSLYNGVRQNGAAARR